MELGFKDADYNRKFKKMVDEMLNRDDVRFDTLCDIAETVLKPKVKHWCKSYKHFKTNSSVDEIISDIEMSLMKKTLDMFLLKDGPNGKVNYDPEGFKRWIITVARNATLDYFKMTNRVNSSVDIDSINESLVQPEEDDAPERIERLRYAFDTALTVDMGIYAVISWIARFVYIAKYNISSINCNNMIISYFENIKLSEMYDIITSEAKYIAWLDISEEQNAKILQALNELWKDGKTCKEESGRSGNSRSPGNPRHSANSRSPGDPRSSSDSGATGNF